MPPHATLPIARAALADLGVHGARLRLLLDGYNTTWEVRVAGRRLALRLTRPGPTEAYVAAEAAWIRALDADLGLAVCAPEGLTFTHGRACLLTRWVPGPQRFASLSEPMLHRVGVTMATLHDQGESWTPPRGWARPTLDDPWLGEPSPLARFPAASADVFAACEERLRPLLRDLVADRCHVLHADLHSRNYRVGRDSMGVLDFDDCALGHPAQDVGISLFYLRRHPRYPALKAAFEAGYRSHRPWPTDDATIEALGVWRAMSTLAHLVRHPNPDIRAVADRLLPEWTARGARWLRTCSEGRGPSAWNH